MKIRNKILLVIASIKIILILGIYIFSLTLVNNEFEKFEKENTEKNVARVLNVLAREIEQVKTTNKDWANWDESYEFASNANEDYLNENLKIESFSTIHIQDVIYLNNEEKIILTKEFDFNSWVEKEMNIEKKQTYTENIESIDDPLTGIMSYNEQLAIFSAHPILKSDFSGPSNGLLIFARHIDEEEVNKIESITELDVSFYSLDGEIPQEIKDSLEQFYSKQNKLSPINAMTTSEKRPHFFKIQETLTGEQIFVDQAKKDFIFGYAILNDLEKNPLLIIQIKLEREFMQQANKTLNYLLLSVILIAIVTGTVLYILLEKKIISRLLKLENEIKQVDEKKKIPILQDSKKDEISSLYSSMKKMFRKIGIADEEVNKKNTELNNYVKELEKTRTANLNMLQDLKETNEHLKDLDKAKSNFLNIVSHELKTPLTAMFAYLDILKDMGTNLTEDEKKSLAAIRRNSDQLKVLINNLLEISRIEAGKFELVNSEIDPVEKINSIMENLKPLAENKGIKLKFEIDKKIPKILTDEQRFEEIFNNLISNAVKFTEKGSITISARTDLDKVLFKVSDTGVGIPKEKLSGLFSKFYQADASLSRKFGGTGLGLSITKQLVELQGGKIWVESQEGKGTTFFFTLPIKQSKKEELKDA